MVAVKTFLAAYSTESQHETLNSEYIAVVVSVRVAEAMLAAEFHRVVNSNNSNSSGYVFRTREYSLPASAAEFVYFVGGTVSEPLERVARYRRRREGSGGGAGGLATPQVLSTYYGIPSVVAHATSISVFEYYGQSFDPSDVSAMENLTCAIGLTIVACAARSIRRKL